MEQKANRIDCPENTSIEEISRQDQEKLSLPARPLPEKTAAAAEEELLRSIRAEDSQLDYLLEQAEKDYGKALLARGHAGKDVKTWQAVLQNALEVDPELNQLAQELGIVDKNGIVLDGKFGDQTEKLTELVQLRYGVTEAGASTGQVGKKTLVEVLCGLAKVEAIGSQTSSEAAEVGGKLAVGAENGNPAVVDEKAAKVVAGPGAEAGLVQGTDTSTSQDNQTQVGQEQVAQSQVSESQESSSYGSNVMTGFVQGLKDMVSWKNVAIGLATGAVIAGGAAIAVGAGVIAAATLAKVAIGAAVIGAGYVAWQFVSGGMKRSEALATGNIEAANLAAQDQGRALADVLFVLPVGGGIMAGIKASRHYQTARNAAQPAIDSVSSLAQRLRRRGGSSEPEVATAAAVGGAAAMPAAARANSSSRAADPAEDFETPSPGAQPERGGADTSHAQDAEVVEGTGITSADLQRMAAEREAALSYRPDNPEHEEAFDRFVAERVERSGLDPEDARVDAVQAWGRLSPDQVAAKAYKPDADYQEAFDEYVDTMVRDRGRRAGDADSVRDEVVSDWMRMTPEDREWMVYRPSSTVERHYFDEYIADTVRIHTEGSAAAYLSRRTATQQWMARTADEKAWIHFRPRNADKAGFERFVTDRNPGSEGLGDLKYHRREATINEWRAMDAETRAAWGYEPSAEDRAVFNDYIRNELRFGRGDSNARVEATKSWQNLSDDQLDGLRGARQRRLDAEQWRDYQPAANEADAFADYVSRNSKDIYGRGSQEQATKDWILLDPKARAAEVSKFDEIKNYVPPENHRAGFEAHMRPSVFDDLFPGGPKTREEKIREWLDLSEAERDSRNFTAGWDQRFAGAGASGNRRSNAGAGSDSRRTAAPGKSIGETVGMKRDVEIDPNIFENTARRAEASSIMGQYNNIMNSTSVSKAEIEAALGYDPSKGEIHKHIRSLLGKYHPDKWGREAEDTNVKDTLTNISQAVQDLERLYNML